MQCWCVSQGSSAGPVLWLIIMNELSDEFKNAEVIAFSDNILIILKTSAFFHFREMAINPLEKVNILIKVTSKYYLH